MVLGSTRDIKIFWIEMHQAIHDSNQLLIYSRIKFIYYRWSQLFQLYHFSQDSLAVSKSHLALTSGGLYIHTDVSCNMYLFLW
jgi:hypothetical protein